MLLIYLYDTTKKKELKLDFFVSICYYISGNKEEGTVLTRSYANGSIIHETPVSRIMMRDGLCAGPFSLSKKTR